VFSSTDFTDRRESLLYDAGSTSSILYNAIALVMDLETKESSIMNERKRLIETVEEFNTLKKQRIESLQQQMEKCKKTIELIESLDVYFNL
jgi:hypothetical protein